MFNVQFQKVLGFHSRLDLLVNDLNLLILRVPPNDPKSLVMKIHMECCHLKSVQIPGRMGAKLRIVTFGIRYTVFQIRYTALCQISIFQNFQIISNAGEFLTKMVCTKWQVENRPLRVQPINLLNHMTQENHKL